MKKPTTASAFLAAKRSLGAIKRLQKKNNSNNNNSNSNNEIIFFESRLISYWVSSSLLATTFKKAKLVIKIPENFSIIDNPEDSLKIISQLAAIARSGRKIHYIECDHSKMKKHDLAAESILGLIASEFEREYYSKNRKLKISGSFPKDEYLTDYIKAIGLIKDLDVKHEFLSKERERKLQIFNMRSKYLLNKVTSGSSDYKEIAARKFVDYINKCLARIGKTLIPEAIDILGEYTGEILNNAHDHGKLDDWTIRGYFDEKHEQHICEIAIFNFGKTIAETFLDLPEKSFAFQSVLPYIEKHHKEGFFSSNWTKETLLTLAALQGDISSKNMDEYSDRGQGTVEMINFFQKIHIACSGNNSPNARMVLLSGNTYVFFDGTYHMKEDNQSRKVIAFNKQNSLLLPPDSNYVKNIAGIKFPGTIISIKFSLEDTNLKNV